MEEIFIHKDIEFIIEFRYKCVYEKSHSLHNLENFEHVIALNEGRYKLSMLKEHLKKFIEEDFTNFDYYFINSIDQTGPRFAIETVIHAILSLQKAQSHTKIIDEELKELLVSEIQFVKDKHVLKLYAQIVNLYLWHDQKKK